MADLSSSVREAVSRHEGLAQLAQQSCRFAEESLAAIQNVTGVREIRTKLDKMVQDPFVDPLSEVKLVSENATRPTAPKRMAVPDEIGQCTVCLGNLIGADESVARTKLQQLKTDWRHEWTTQLKQELVAFGQQTGKINSQVAGCIATVNDHTRTSSVSDTDELADLISEVMSTKCWDDDDGASSIPEMRPTSTSRKSAASSDVTNKLQRLQTKYESSQKRNQILIEEITDLKKENLELQDDVSRLRDRFAKVRATPSMQIESLQRECEDLRYLTDQATENFNGLKVSYEKLQCDRQLEKDRASFLDQELATLRDHVESKCQEIEKLNSSAAMNALEMARLQALEISHNDLIQSKSSAERQSRIHVEDVWSPPRPKRLTRHELPEGACELLFELHINFRPRELGILCLIQDLHPNSIAERQDTLQLRLLMNDLKAGGSTMFANGEFGYDIIYTDTHYIDFGWILYTHLRHICAQVRKVYPLRATKLLEKIQHLEKGKGFTMFDLGSGEFVKRSTPSSQNINSGADLAVCWMKSSDKLKFGYTED